MRDEKVRGKFDENELKEFIDNNRFNKSNGVVYRTDKKGLIHVLF